jgi:protein-tyrosine phosphatase
VWEPNLTFVTPQLAVGGRIPTGCAEDLVRDLGVRAVVDLRSEACDEEEVLQRHGVAFLHLPTDDHCAVSQAMLDEGVAFAKPHLDRGERVLVHCEYGIGRSALLALCIHVGEGLEPLLALEVAKATRPQVSPSPAQYEAWIQWLERRRGVHAESWSIPDFDAFKAVAYRHLRGIA